MQMDPIIEKPFLLFKQTRLLACPLAGIREILNPMTLMLTPVPNTLPCVHGLLNLRGELLPILDLGYLLDRHRNRAIHPNRIIVLETWSAAEEAFQRLGLLVEQIFQVIQCSREQVQTLEQVQPEMEELPPSLTLFVSEVCRYNQSIWPIVSPKALMSPQLWTQV